MKVDSIARKATSFPPFGEGKAFPEERLHEGQGTQKTKANQRDSHQEKSSGF
jgi:hypothetical protein